MDLHTFEISSVSAIIAFFSAVVAVLSLVYGRMSWLEANRPLVTARITAATDQGSEGPIPLNILVENTGNRPAQDIRLKADRGDVLAALK